MYDSSHADTIPADAPAAAGYVDRSKSFGPIRDKVPHAHLMSIATHAENDADCLDVEDGLATPDQIPKWYQRQRDRNVARPVIYANASDMTAVLAELKGASIPRSSVRLWSAHYRKNAAQMKALSQQEGAQAVEKINREAAHICGPDTCRLVMVPMDGTQFTSWAHNVDLDQSLLRDDFFGPPSPPPSVTTSDGHKSLNALGTQLRNAVSTMLRLTAEHSPGAVFHQGMADYLNGVFAADQEKVPEGITVYHPAGNGVQAFNSHGTQTLQGLALAFQCLPSAIVRCTAESSPGAVFSGGMASYLNDVFSRSTTPLPQGVHVFYQK
jgi:hypothetical protein